MGSIHPTRYHVEYLTFDPCSYSHAVFMNLPGERLSRRYESGVAESDYQRIILSYKIPNPLGI